MLRSMETERADFPGFRQALMISNFTKRSATKRDWALSILGFSASAEHAPLVRNLAILEWTDKYVRMSWIHGAGIHEPTLREAVNWLAQTGGDTDDALNKAAAMQFAARCVFSGADEASAGRALISPVSNINYALTVLWKYKELNERRVEGAFLKVFTIAGEICGRSVRMKTHDTHSFVLTDMLYSFDCGPSQVVTLHIISAIQAVGRLCTLVVDPAAAPRIRLWTPTSNWKLLSHWMDVIDELAPLHELREDGETLEGALDRVVADDSLPGFEALRRHFCAPTGASADGVLHGGRLDHRAKFAKRKFVEAHAIAEEKDSVPEGVELANDAAAQTTAAAGLAAAEAAREAMRGMDHGALAQTPSEEEEEEQLPDTAFRPIPQPQPLAFLMPTVKRRRASAASASDAYTEKDLSEAFGAVSDLRALRARIPDGTHPDAVAHDLVIKLWAAFYTYFMHMQHAAQGPASARGHGIHTTRNRLAYAATVQKVVSAGGARVWKRFSDLPQSDTPEDRARTQQFVTRYVENLGFSKTKLSNKPASLSPFAHQVKDLTSHLLKWVALFPQVADLRAWLCTSPLPEQATLPAPVAAEEEEDDDLFGDA